MLDQGAAQAVSRKKGNPDPLKEKKK